MSGHRRGGQFGLGMPRWMYLPLFLVLLPLLLGGCVIIPYRPSAEAKIETVELKGDEIQITIGPRRSLEALGKAIIAADGNIEIVDALTFRDSAFPDGKWNLKALLEAERLERVRALGLDYLVLLGTYADNSSYRKGFMTFYLGFFGLQWGKESGTLPIVLVDLVEGGTVRGVTCSAEGSSFGAGAFYALFVVPDVKTPLFKRAGAAISEAVRQRGPGTRKIAVLAAEQKRTVPEDLH